MLRGTKKWIVFVSVLTLNVPVAGLAKEVTYKQARKATKLLEKYEAQQDKTPEMVSPDESIEDDDESEYAPVQDDAETCSIGSQNSFQGLSEFLNFDFEQEQKSSKKGKKAKTTKHKSARSKAVDPFAVSPSTQAATSSTNPFDTQEESNEATLKTDLEKLKQRALVAVGLEDSGELIKVKKELQDFAAAHPEHKGDVFAIFISLAQNLEEDNQYQAAKDMYSAAKPYVIDGTSGKHIRSKQHSLDLKIIRLLAAKGETSNPQFKDLIVNHTARLKERLVLVCSSSPEECMTIQQELAELQQLGTSRYSNFAFQGGIGFQSGFSGMYPGMQMPGMYPQTGMYGSQFGAMPYGQGNIGLGFGAQGGFGGGMYPGMQMPGMYPQTGMYGASPFGFQGGIGLGFGAQGGFGGGMYPGMQMPGILPQNGMYQQPLYGSQFGGGSAYQFNGGVGGAAPLGFPRNY